MKLKEIEDILSKIPKLVKKYEQAIFLATCLILIAVIGYNIGKISTAQKTEPTKENPYQANLTRVTPTPIDKRVVVSKKSQSMLYHFTFCSGAKSIKEENKIWFNTEEEAIRAGYKLSGNCKP